jgi:hypothetical protein
VLEGHQVGLSFALIMVRDAKIGVVRTSNKTIMIDVASTWPFLLFGDVLGPPYYVTAGLAIPLVF